MNIIYLRVSKEKSKAYQEKHDREKQDPEQQKKQILKRFNLDIKDCVVYEERGSAYKIEKTKNRKEFLNIMNVCFNAERTTIKDLFLEKEERSEINLYVWDYSRIIRNIELNLLFSIFANMYNVKIHSFKDKSILKESEVETPTAKLTRIMMNTISAFSSEEYSYTISTNTKKSYRGDGFSSYGKQWGRGFKRVEGGRFHFEDNESHEKFKEDIKEKRFFNNWSGVEIIAYAKKKYGLVLTHSYLTKNFKKKR